MAVRTLDMACYWSGIRMFQCRLLRRKGAWHTVGLDAHVFDDGLMRRLSIRQGRRVKYLTDIRRLPPRLRLLGPVQSVMRASETGLSTYSDQAVPSVG